jgi:hypothetical protein
MHRSSESIGTIAAALARAQAELTNPEKSLVATIRSPFPRESDRTFRYAPLSSGLDIIRKSLGKQEIATVQTTEIDNEFGLVRLTTILAHSSGEWVSSEWPVCPITDTASPQRMGSALTYARRYALFTLVGIAGEDDLDAPEEADPKAAAGQPNGANGRFHPSANAHTGRANGHNQQTAGRSLPRAAKPILAPDESGALRDQMMAQVEAITTSDEALAWALRSLPMKNTLTASDATVIEETFKIKTNVLTADQKHEAGRRHELPALEAAEGPLDVSAGADATRPDLKQSNSEPTRRTRRQILKTHRIRDKGHREFVGTQPCLVCGRHPSDAHHLRHAQPRALGRKVSDEFTVPLCRIHHREIHQVGNEAAWWETAKIDPLQVAQLLWQKTANSNGAKPPSP